MDRLRQIPAGIARQLARLSAAHRVIIALLCVVIALTLFVVVQTAGRSEMVPLLPGEAAPDQQRAIEWLAARGAKHKLRGDGAVLVPATERGSLFAQMAQAGQLPADKSLLFANLAESTSWTMTRDQQRQMSTFALQNELARWIGEFDGVKKASVFIDVPEPMGLGSSFRKPTASVAVIAEPGRAIDQKLVDAIAHFVAGARSGLEAANVRVIDGATGKQRSASGDDDLLASTYLDYAGRVEGQLRDKILGLVAHIPGAVVAVTAQVDVTRASISIEKYLPSGQGTVSLPKRSMEEESSQKDAAPGGEAGLRSNVALDVTRGAGGGASTTKTSTEDEYDNRFGKRTESIVDPRGMPTFLAATINIPQSYVAAVIRGANAAGVAGGHGGGDAPTAEEIKARFDEEKAAIEAAVKPHLVARGPGDGGPPVQGEVKVTLIPVDYTPAGGAGGAGAGFLGSGGGGGLGGVLAGGVVDTAILGVLAVMAVGLMAVMVKRAGQRVELPTPEELVGVPPALASASDLIGEADESHAPLAGIEVGDDDMKAANLLEQVRELVAKSPEDAARLVNRWVSQEE